jgi:nucleoside-diphosphate-sugar epimerase
VANRPCPRIGAVRREGTTATAAGERVRDRLAGRKILLTGASGFLGKAVLATLLRSAPEIDQLVIMLRAPGGATAAERLDGVLATECFDGIPGDAVRSRIESGRIRALRGDLELDGLGDQPAEALAGIDTVIHCAATVSFEEALDDALALNTFGPVRLLRRLRESGSDPELVHVSTAYVADRQSGRVLEDGVPHHGLADLEPDQLYATGRRWREEVERESIAEPQRSAFAKAADRDASRRKDLDASERAEELRRRWVREKLSRRSRRYAIELGWPDTYALSKALGERIVGERSAPTTVIRPTIIESALKTPNPGWLEGIKVADPLILAYASGGLTHLPGRAGNVIDIVPVDLVANACVVAAAHPPESGLRTIAIASSARNPLSIGRLAEEIREYFLREPLIGRNGSPIKIGNLKFVDRRVALRRTIARERLAAAAARAVMASPIHLPQERKLRSARSLAERVTRMVKIYGAYTELDCVFDDANACRLGELMPEADRAELSFDTAAIDWHSYLQEAHLPQVRRLAGGGT